MSYTWGAIFLLLPILRRVGLQESKYSSVSSVQCGICASSVVEGGEGYVTAHTVGLVAAFLEWEGVEGNELLQERAV